MNAPVLIDFFCKAGGASMGYHRAGFRVIGVDKDPQPNYPFTFFRGDAIELFDPLVLELRPAAVVGLAAVPEALAPAHPNAAGLPRLHRAVPREVLGVGPALRDRERRGSTAYRPGVALRLDDAASQPERDLAVPAADDGRRPASSPAPAVRVEPHQHRRLPRLLPAASIQVP